MEKSVKPDYLTRLRLTNKPRSLLGGRMGAAEGHREAAATLFFRTERQTVFHLS